MRAWLLSIRRKLHKVKADNKGMSIVTVIVAVGFVAILVSIIMLASIVNFKMKSVNVYSKESFYSAEQVVDEINVGLQQLVSDGLSAAYTDVVTNYSSSDMTAAEKNDLVKKKYYEYLWDKLGADAAHNTYVVQASTNAGIDESGTPRANADVGLMGLLKNTTKWHYGDEKTSFGAFLRAEIGGTYNNVNGDGNYYGTMTTYDKTGIVLEDLTVYYKDTNGFVSAIKTDIRLGYPGFVFSTTDIPQISTYSFITDTAFVQENPGVSKGSARETEIYGDTYAYAVDISGYKHTYGKYNSGDDLHIVATDYNVVNGGLETNGNSVLWAKDIITKSSNTTLAGYTYVYDDFNIKGRDNVVTIKGYYTGYGNSINSSDESSAILVNGVNTSIDLTNIRKLSLAGRAYIGTTDKSGKIGRVSADSNTEKDSSASNVYTGEAIAVKSNQLMYLVPGDCIGVAVDAQGGAGESMYGKNPLSLEQYNLMMSSVNGGGASAYVEVAGNKKLYKLNANGGDYTLDDFVAVDASGKPKVEKVFMKTADGSSRLVYYYMTFKDEAAANLYFRTYYGVNSDAVDRYMSKYLSALTLADGGMTTVTLDMAAESLSGTKDTGYQINTAVRTPEAGTTLSESFDLSQKTYANSFRAYCSKLTSDYDSLTAESSSDKVRNGFPEYDPETNKMKIKEESSDGYSAETGNENYYTVFKNLVNEDVLKELASSGEDFTTPDGKCKAVFIYNSDVDHVETVSLSAGTTYLVVANCGVRLNTSGKENVKLESGETVQANFKGTIIAKGIVQAGGSALTIASDPENVETVLSIQSADEVYTVSDVFKESDDLEYKKAVKGATNETVTTASLVTYENWSKNVSID